MTIKELEKHVEARLVEVMETMKELAVLVGEARADLNKHKGQPDAHNPGMMYKKKEK